MEAKVTFPRVVAFQQSDKWTVRVHVNKPFNVEVPTGSSAPSQWATTNDRILEVVESFTAPPGGDEAAVRTLHANVMPKAAGTSVLFIVGPNLERQFHLVIEVTDPASEATQLEIPLGNEEDESRGT